MKKRQKYFTVLLLLGGMAAGCTPPQMNLFIDDQPRIGDYTCDKNAYYLLIGKIDELRAGLAKDNLEYGVGGEYKAFKKAQQIILEDADQDKNKHITAAEAYSAGREQKRKPRW